MDEKLLVLDAMTGQEAVNIAEQFAERVGYDGVVLTKLDGDARGGAALSVKEITGKPVKLVGVGEKLDDLEVFHPDRMASRILGMGDVLTLIEQAEDRMDLDEAQDLADRFGRGEFTLEDFQRQIKQIKRMGSFKGMMKLLPGMGGGRPGQGRRRRRPVHARRGHHQLHDAPGTAQARHHQRLAPQAHRPGQRDQRLAGQQAAQAVPGHAPHDEADQRCAGGLQEFGQKVLGGGPH